MAVEHQILGQEKTCTKCGFSKDLSDFHLEARNTGIVGAGRYSWCKSCGKMHKSTPERLNRTKYQIDFNVGFSGDDTKVLEDAAAYLKRWREGLT